MDFQKLLKPYKDESLKNLASWIKINSIYDEQTVTSEHPFGQGVFNALDFIARLAEQEGFDVDRCDNYCTEISCGTGEKLIALYAHADVVPVSGEWNYEPFGAVIEDNKMYGRGTSDDKGPAMAAFYALKALKDNNLISGYRVSLVIGGNEETGSRCLEHYFNVLHKPYPTYGFTPDGDFPLIYGEKGISNYEQKVKINNTDIVSLKGGVAPNSVIDEAKAVIKHTPDLTKACETFFSLTSTKYSLKAGEENDELVVYGLSSHGSMPEKGKNAALYLIKFLGWFYHDELLNKIADSYLETSGKKMGVYYESEYLHATTYNVGLVTLENGVLEMVINFRHPENCDPHEVERKLNELEFGEIKFLGYGEHLLMDPHSPMIETLLKVYQEETGDVTTPIETIGGGTYAKESKNTIAFGSHFPGKVDNIHSPNEKIDLEDFFTSQGIYARAIYELGRLK